MKDEVAVEDQGTPKDDPVVQPFDPFEEHFVSQNTKNDFLKGLETRPPAD
jgi:hypothetical protein